MKYVFLVQLKLVSTFDYIIIIIFALNKKNLSFNNNLIFIKA